MSADTDRAAAIAEVVDTLTRLGARPPGSKLPAADWNALVDVVGRVARLPAFGAAAAAPSAELPPGSVSFDELAPDVQQMLRSGPFAGTAGSLLQRQLDGRISALNDRMASIEAKIDSLVTSVTRAQTDVSRQGKDIRLVDQRAAGAVVLKDEVGDLRTLVGSVREDISVVKVLRDEVAGVDLRKIRTSVDELIGFRNDWRDEQGNAVSFASFNRRLADAQNDVVSTAELGRILDARLAAVGVEIEPIETRLTNKIRTELLTAKDEIRVDQQNRLTEGLTSLRNDLTAEVTRSVGSSIAELTPRLTTIATDAADQRVTVARDALRREFTGIVDARIQDFDPGVSKEDLNGVKAGLSTRIDTLSRDAIKKSDLTVGLDDVRSTLGTRVDGIAGRLDAAQRSQNELATALRKERTDAATQESRRLEGLITERVRQESVERNGAVDAVGKQVSRDLRAELATTATTLRTERDAAVTRIVEAKTAEVSTKLEGRLKIIANDAVAALEDDVIQLRRDYGQLDAQVTTLDTTVTGWGSRIGSSGVMVAKTSTFKTGEGMFIGKGVGVDVVKAGPDVDFTVFNPGHFDGPR